MGQSTDELRREISRTRGDMSETLEAIGDHVSPSRILQRRKNRMANGLRSVRERVMGTANEVGDTVAEKAGTVAGTAAGKASNAVDTIADAPDAMRGQAREQVQGSPLGAGAVAFGLGFVAAAVFPPTEAEKRAGQRVAENVEPVKEELKELGQQAAEDLKEPAKDAVESVKQTAKEGAEQVADTAKAAAEEDKESMREATEQVKSTVKSENPSSGGSPSPSGSREPGHPM